MLLLPCPHLEAVVKFTAERQQHVAQRHPDLMPGHLAELRQTLADPDSVRRSLVDPEPILLTRWFSQLRGGRFIVVVVKYDHSAERFWLLTAYLARSLAGGEIEWQRD